MTLLYFRYLITMTLGAIAMSASAAEPFQPTQAYADRFANEWVAAWNSHDIERILSHYTEDFSMTSPLIALRGVEPSGRLRGKAAVQAYWQPALGENATLHFELIQALVTADGIAIHYRSNAMGGRLCVETLRMNAAGEVTQGSAYYYPAIESL